MTMDSHLILLTCLQICYGFELVTYHKTKGNVNLIHQENARLKSLKSHYKELDL